jgi:hypothetical protein
MAAWFTVYCLRPASRITPDDLLAAIEESDLHTVAEGFGIEDDAVDQALSLLQIEPADGTAGVRFRILYKPPEFRPMFFYRP